MAIRLNVAAMKKKVKVLNLVKPGLEFYFLEK